MAYQEILILWSISTKVGRSQAILFNHVSPIMESSSGHSSILFGLSNRYQSRKKDSKLENPIGVSIRFTAEKMEAIQSRTSQPYI
jgi:hypothetical protein